jgi:hypothetical protein
LTRANNDTLIRQRTATGTEFENIIDADPIDVQTEYDRVDGRGMMIVRDRRSDEPSRTTGLNRTVYASGVVAIEATDHPADALPLTMIESELRARGQAFLAQDAAELAGLIAEAMAAGMPVETIAQVSGVPVENIRRLSAGG